MIEAASIRSVQDLRDCFRISSKMMSLANSIPSLPAKYLVCSETPTIHKETEKRTSQVFL